MRRPQELTTIDEKGEFRIMVKKENRIVEFVVDHHPFDVVGWDGFYYPWALNIHDFEPRVGRFHLPPPVHQTFEGDGFVICSFCPRPYDFDPEAVPAPYNHSNVMSDEVLYYANSEFMSRKGIEYGSITLHPDGLPHGPHPGRTESSIGKAHTDELAVMVDTFRPCWSASEPSIWKIKNITTPGCRMTVTSWVESANRPDTDFPLENLPLGVRKPGRVVTAIGNFVLDLHHLMPDPADLLRSGRIPELRQYAYEVLREDSAHRPELLPLSDCEMMLPVEVGDYTDFYASIDHAMNIGKLFRPESPLLPNYKHMPIAYHGRASTIVISGTPVQRPNGQLGPGEFGPSRRLDYEMELGLLIGPNVTMAGFCIVNDWSARDIQRWEYQPLGPFLSKNFATTISPWIVTPEALSAAFTEMPARSPDDPELLPYLRANRRALHIELTACLNGDLMGRSNTRDLYWSFGQMMAHHQSNGCRLRPGDLLASGTVSGPAPEARGCLLEIRPEGPYLQDGDEVVMRAHAKSPSGRRIGWGECRGRIVPADYF